MSDKTHTEGHWETQSFASQTIKVGDAPAVTVGKEAEAKGTFDHGKAIVTDAHQTTFTDQGHPGTLEYHKQGGNQQKSIK